MCQSTFIVSPILSRHSSGNVDPGSFTCRMECLDFCEEAHSVSQAFVAMAKASAHVNCGCVGAQNPAGLEVDSQICGSVHARPAEG